MKQRKFEAHEVQRAAAKRELEIYLEALCHDYQYSIRRACRLLEILALPERMKKADQFEELEKRLALRRETQGWGRPWNKWQLDRCYYAKAKDFRRLPPKPVTREELASYAPYFPPAAVAANRNRQKKGSAAG